MIKLEDIKINEDWKSFLKDEFLKPYFAKIKENYIKELKQGKNIFPPANLVFNAFNLCPLNKIKVVLLGQDPYHQKHQAMGLSFSVPKDLSIPPSLRNIFKELKDDLNLDIAKSGDLSKWAKEGVLLLNSILTVEEARPLSHANFGWEIFSDAVIKKLSDEKEHLVFLLWGNFAKSKKNLINPKKHLVLLAAHPSPLARVGFLGCKHFSKTNAYLIKHSKAPIDWDLSKQNA
ncbi:MAG TPA: uracil-DNA glycosylase [Campylobacter avium]|uniref:uracil-DNA glycosylase n=1 Tax=Campylobacter avium TaxID=522485 RepID=UPI001E1A184F|nr:uracil-DNA glycosylase [Campylobacter avium]HJE66477.1 uracil-DNA glycosylase [Campylobacter avium]